MLCFENYFLLIVLAFAECIDLYLRDFKCRIKPTNSFNNSRIFIDGSFQQGLGERLHVLGGVNFRVQQQVVEQLGSLHSSLYNPVAQISHDSSHQLAQVSLHELPASQLWPFNCNSFTAC